MTVINTTRRSQRGSTLLELLVAVALFTIISGVTFNLINQQQNASTSLNGQVTLSMGLRNATSLLQLDLANAGAGYFQTATASSPVLGVTMVNNVVLSGSTLCNSSSSGVPSQIYNAPCFDQLNIITIDTGSPTLIPLVGTVTNTGTATATLPSGSSFTPATAAATFHKGDILLFVNGTPTAEGASYTAVTLTGVPTNTGTTVTFRFNATSATGTNTLANDPLNITACSGAIACPPASPVSGVTTFAFPQATFGTSDYIMKIAPVSYQVCSGPGSPTTATGALYSCNTSSTSPDISDPKLYRTTIIGGVTSSSVVLEQIIGFKVGGSVWNDPDPNTGGLPNDIPYYDYDASTYNLGVNNASDHAYNFSALHSVRVSLIARTPPQDTSNYVYRNAFDSGPYQVQGTALVVNPRNMNAQTY